MIFEDLEHSFEQLRQRIDLVRSYLLTFPASDNS